MNDQFNEDLEFEIYSMIYERIHKLQNQILLLSIVSLVLAISLFAHIIRCH